LININKKKLILSFTTILFVVFLTPFFASSVLGALYEVSPPKDSDFDGLTDQAEIQMFFTNPFISDTDGDGFIDGAEIISGTNPNDASDPRDTFSSADYKKYQQNYEKIIDTNVAQKEFSASWPWYTSRASGIIAYILLFLLIVSGIGIKTGFIYKITNPDLSWVIHRNISFIMTISIVIHCISLLFDEYIKFTLLDVLSPFAPKVGGVYLSMGIISFYIIIAAIITSLFYQQKYPRVWQIVHYLPYPVFILIFLHGTMMGSDSKTFVMQAVYWTTGISFILLLIYRVFMSSGWPDKVLTTQK